MAITNLGAIDDKLKASVTTSMIMFQRNVFLSKATAAGLVQTARLSQQAQSHNGEDMITFNVFKRARQAPVLYGTQASKPRRTNNNHNRPPQTLLTSDVLPQASKEQHKRELDGPKARIEKRDHGNRSSQIGRRVAGKIGRGRKQLPGFDGNDLVQIIFAHLPDQGVGHEEQTCEEHHGVICVQAAKGFDSAGDSSGEEDQCEGDASPSDTLSVVSISRQETLS